MKQFLLIVLLQPVAVTDASESSVGSCESTIASCLLDIDVESSEPGCGRVGSHVRAMQQL